MSVTMQWDKREFRQALKKLAAVHEKTIPQVCNQTLLDITGHAFDSLTPADVESKRDAIRSELNREIGEAKWGKRQLGLVTVQPTGIYKLLGASAFNAYRKRSRMVKVGKRKGKAARLYAKNLIANWWRGQQGKKGLYGEAMKRYTGAMTKRRLVGVGSLKSVFLPVIRALNRAVSSAGGFPFPFSKTAHIARWSGSKAYGIANTAKNGKDSAEFEIGYDPKSRSAGKVGFIYTRALDDAFAWKEGKIERELERAIAKDTVGVST